MTCVSRIATVRAWLEARLLERETDPARAAEILDDSTFVSAGATIYVDFREPPEARAVTFEFAGPTIRRVSGLDDTPPASGAPASGDPGSRVPA
ncbi:MAG TPA: hypothetical protein VHW26_12110 [Solirubrobacteraceae bacterium]|jgi:hypothetical protein|nr:hypothetical protein [Solirubrobacteraceae bacterium]